MFSCCIQILTKQGRTVAGLGLILLGAVVAYAQPAAGVNALEYRPVRSDVRRTEPPPSFDRGQQTIAPRRLGRPSSQERTRLQQSSRLEIVGLSRAVGPEVVGEWVVADDGKSVYRVALQSDGASALRVHFAGFSVGRGKVWAYDTDRSQVLGPYTGSGMDGTGDFWSPALNGDTVVIDFEPASGTSHVPFKITEVAHIDPHFAISATGHDCEQDLSCYPDWSQNSSGMAMYLVQKDGATFKCTGALLNNPRQDYTPYFLTSHQCVPDDATARTIQVFWMLRSGSCQGSAPDMKTAPSTLGASYLTGASLENGDYALLKLTSLPNANLLFYGWDASSTGLGVGDQAVGLYHSMDSQHIAFGTRAPDGTLQISDGSQTFSAAAGTYQMLRLTSGRPIGSGSTGSPLFTKDLKLVGTLTGGTAAPKLGGECSVDPYISAYSRMSTAYPALAAYLGATTSAAGLQPSSGPQPNPNEAASDFTISPAAISWSWVENNPSQAAPEFIRLTTASATPITVQIGANQPWVKLSSTALVISQQNPGVLSVALEPSALTKPGANTAAISLIGPGGNNHTVTVQLNALATQFSPSLGAAMTVFPLFIQGPGYQTSLAVANPYSTETKVFLQFSSYDGSPLIIDPSQYVLGEARPSQAWVPPAGNPASWEELTIAPSQTTTLSTSQAGPLRQGMVWVWTEDPTKQIPVTARLNGSEVPAATPVSLPLSIPFDATVPGTTKLFLLNNDWWLSTSLTVKVVGSNGVVLATEQFTIGVREARNIDISAADPHFANMKGTIVVSGTGGKTVAAALRVDSTGQISKVQ